MRARENSDDEITDENSVQAAGEPGSPLQLKVPKYPNMGNN